jgi:hypothetical protein
MISLTSPDKLGAETRYSELDKRESLVSMHMRASTIGTW